METKDRIKTIEELNALGMRLARTPTMSNALQVHAAAAELAKDPSINLDYHLISNANMGYALRQLGQYHEAGQLLRDSLIQSATRSPLATYGGRGRVYEELGLVVADVPLAENANEARIKNTQEGLATFALAIQDYDAALHNQGEVYTPLQLQQRRLRTIGMQSPKARNLAELTAGAERQDWLKKAVTYATQEVDARESMGEKEGQNLANSYHSLGQVLSELVVEDSSQYSAAKQAFEKAAAVPGVAENTKTTLYLRRAWLEYKREASAKEAIAPLFDTFLKQSSILTSADKSSLQRRVLELGRHLGSDYTLRAEKF